MNRLPLAALAGLVLWTAVPAQAQYMTQVWEQPDLGEFLGSAGLLVHDLDGDGDLEILVTSVVPMSWSGPVSSRFFVMEEAGAGFAVAAASPYISGPSSYGEYPLRSLAVRDGDEGAVLYALLWDGAVQTFRGATLAPLGTLRLDAGPDPKQLIVADVDGDGALEFVVRGEASVRVFDATTGALEWHAANPGSDIEVGDVDGDGRAEVVLASGRVLDGATGAVEWTYADGFGTLLALANVDADPALEIVGYNGGYALQAFDAAVRSPLWELGLDTDVGALVATNARGAWEIVVGPGQWGPVRSYRAATREVAWQINNPEHSTTNLALGDLDGDGTAEVVWGAGQRSTGPDVLFVGDPDSQSIAFQTTDLDGPFFVQVGDIDGDGPLEVVTATRASRSSYSGGVVTAFDGATHAVRWALADIEGSYRYRGDIHSIGVDAAAEGGAQAYVGSNRWAFAVGGAPPSVLWENSDLQDQTAWAFGDLDRNGTTEVVSGDTQGRVTVLDGTTRAVLWQSISTSGEIGGIRLANLDADAALEVVFFNENGRVRVYDGATHLLEWESTDITDATALDVADLDRDGTPEVVVGRADGQVTVLQAGTFAAVGALGRDGAAVTGLRVGNIDGSPEPEVVVVDGSARVVAWPSGDVLWEGPALGSGAGRRDGVHLADLDDDGFMDLVVGGPSSVVQYEATERYPDTRPPVVTASTPPEGTAQVSTDVAATFTFSEPLAPASVDAGVRVLADGAEIATAAQLSAEGTRLTVGPIGEWPANAAIEVVLLSTLTDTAGNGLDGDRDGVSEGSPVDDVRLAFRTGSGVDTVGPSVARLTASRDTVWAGIPVRFEGVATDTSSVSASGVAAVEYFVGAAGPAGTGTALAALDGAFDEVEEPVALDLVTSGLAGGRYTVSVRARDTRGTWGPLAAAAFVVRDEGASEWAQFGHDAQHTGFNAVDTLTVPLRTAWQASVTTDNSALRAPVVAAGKVVLAVGGWSGGGMQVLTLDAETGAPGWSYAFGTTSGISMPAVAYGRVYVQTNDHTPGSYVWALDAETGARVWQSAYPSQWSFGNAPTVADGGVFVNAGYYGGMRAYDALDGAERWSIDLPQDFDWTPTYADGMVYAGWDQASFYAVDAAGGDLSYVFGSPGRNPRTAAFRDSVLYTVNPLAAIDLRDQTVRWSKPGDLTPAIAYGRVYAVAGGTLFAYDEATGQQLWRFGGSTDLVYPPIVAGGHVFVSTGSRAFAVRADDGTQAWTFGAGGPMAVAGGRLYLAATSGTVYAFESGAPTAAAAPDAPHAFAVWPSRPNPVRDQTTVAFTLPEAGPVVVEVFDALGRRVATLADGVRSAGRHEVTWDARGVGAGLYSCRIRAGAESGVVRMSVVR